MSDAKQSRRYLVSGKVQGVGYRYFTQKAARKLQLCGYVKNLADGRVEVFATGTLPQLANLRTALQQGPLFSNVSQVQEEVAGADDSTSNDFIITSGY